jgi:hypothetical protein
LFEKLVATFQPRCRIRPPHLLVPGFPFRAIETGTAFIGVTLEQTGERLDRIQMPVGRFQSVRTRGGIGPQRLLAKLDYGSTKVVQLRV